MSDGRVKAPAAKDSPRRISFQRCVEWYGAQPKRVAALLRDACRVISRNTWTPRAAARDSVGKPCSPLSEDARAFSIGGAITVAAKSAGAVWFESLAADAALRDVIGGESVAFEDARGRQSDEILNAFHRAIWRAENFALESA